MHASAAFLNDISGWISNNNKNRIANPIPAASPLHSVFGFMWVVADIGLGTTMVHVQYQTDGFHFPLWQH